MLAQRLIETPTAAKRERLRIFVQPKNRVRGSKCLRARIIRPRRLQAREGVREIGSVGLKLCLMPSMNQKTASKVNEPSAVNKDGTLVAAVHFKGLAEAEERIEAGEGAFLDYWGTITWDPMPIGPGAIVTQGAKVPGLLMRLLKFLKNPKTALKSMRAASQLSKLRKQYVNAVKELAGNVPGMRKKGLSSEQIARALHAERRALGVQFKNITPGDKLAKIYKRNLVRYGDELGPSIDWLRKNNKSWDQIIESATRPGGKDLGL